MVSHDSAKSKIENLFEATIHKNTTKKQAGMYVLPNLYYY
jgi:hypothetical protein